MPKLPEVSFQIKKKRKKEKERELGKKKGEIQTVDKTPWAVSLHSSSDDVEKSMPTTARQLADTS